MAGDPLQALQHLLTNVAFGVIAFAVLAAIFFFSGTRTRIALGCVIVTIVVLAMLYSSLGLLGLLRVLATAALLAFLFRATTAFRYQGELELGQIIATIASFLAVCALNVWIRWPPTISAVAWTVGLAAVDVVAGARYGRYLDERDTEAEESERRAATAELSRRKRAEAASLEQAEKEQRRQEEWARAQAERRANQVVEAARRAEMERRRKEQEQEIERQKREEERRKKEHSRWLADEEKAAILEAEKVDSSLTVERMVKRRIHALEELYRLTQGHLTRNIPLTSLAAELELSPGQTLIALASLQQGGNVRIHQPPDNHRNHWTDQEVSLAAEGVVRVERHYEPGGKGDTVTNEYHDKVYTFNEKVNAQNVGDNEGQLSAGIIGDEAEVERVDTRNTSERAAFERLLAAVSAAREHVQDPYQADLLTERMKAVEVAESAEKKRSALERLMGVAESLGKMATPILEAAGQFKDLVS